MLYLVCTEDKMFDFIMSADSYEDAIKKSMLMIPADFGMSEHTIKAIPILSEEEIDAFLARGEKKNDGK